MGAALDLLEAAHDERQAHDHLLRECPWYRHVDGGGREHMDLRCRPAAGKKPPRLVVKLTPRTGEASTVPQPTVPPGGPGLFHVKGMQLPPYVQHLYKHLVSRYGEHKAYGVAVGIVKKWASGVNPGGKHPTKTHADVRAAAQKNVAEWEEKRARAHAQSHEHAEHRAAASTVGLAVTGSAPGAAAITTSPGSRPQYGLFQHPALAISPTPPTPPKAKMPTAAEVRAVASQVPQGADVTLTNTIRKFLDQAAGKLNRDAPLEALAALRGAQTAVYSAHKADLAAAGPAPYTANVFVPPAEQSSATAAMRQSLSQTLAYRKLGLQVAELADRLRRSYFPKGIYAGPSQPIRLTSL